jgi:cytoskeletal protein CcmA (bactofilin family)
MTNKNPERETADWNFRQDDESFYFESIEIKQKKYSYFAKDLRLKGEFYLSGKVNLSCQIEGDIFMLEDENSFLTIEREGHFRGNIECQNIQIFGQFVGSIKAKGKLIIQPQATVSGNIEAHSLTICPGAQCNFEGHTTAPTETKLN